MIRRVRGAAAGGLVAVAVAVVAAGAPPVTGADADRTLRIGTTQEFDSINPNLALIASSAEASTLQYDALVGLGPDMSYAPTGFAQSWTNNGLTWTFTIRDGLRWSDGEVADGDDVAFTYRYLLASLDPSYIGPWAPAGSDLPRPGFTRPDGRADHPLSLYGDVLTGAAGLRTVQLVDAHTITLTTAYPTTLLLGALVPILPEHIWATIPFAAASTSFQRDPPVVGSGPFQIAEWQRGSLARFVRNPFYWGSRPYLDEVEFGFFPDTDALAAALRNGEIDYARGIAPADVDVLDRDRDIDVVEGQGSGFTHVAFNTYAQPIDGGGASTAAVRDPRFRDALGYAVDRGAIIDAAVDGHATPATTLIPPAVTVFHAEPSHPRIVDEAEAERRLAAAGYVDADEDGVREDLDGRPIDLRLYYPTSDSRYVAAAVALAGQWERIGITVTPKGLEPDALAEQLYTPEAGGTAEYDAVIWSWSGSPDPDFLLSLLTTGQIGKWSDSSYSNPAYDRLFDAQRRAATVDERRSVIAKMLDVIYDDAPYLVLFYDDALDAHRTDRFGGWTEGAAATTPLFTAGVQGYLDLGPPPAAAPSPTARPPVPSTPAAPTPLDDARVSGFPLPFALSAGQTTLGLAGALLGTAVLVLALITSRMRGRRR